MKTRNLIFTALTALALTALAGCSSETELLQEAPDVIPEGMARVEFAIKGVKTGSSYAASPTVGLDPAERQINDVTAYLFKMAGGQSVIADTDPVAEVVATVVSNGKASFLMPADAIENDRYAVVLIGNSACYNATALAAVVKGSNYAALNAVETVENTAIMGALLNGGLPMRALTSITIPAGGGKVTVDAKFARPLSRFDIDNRALHSFKITSVVLVNGRTTSQLNVPGTAGVVAGTPADVTYSTFISDVNERLTPPDLNPDGSNSKLRPAFYASPALDADNASLLVKGTLRSGLSEFPAEYVVPLVNKTTSAKIVIGANKRYRVTLTMDKDDNIVGEIALDLGEWEDNDLVNPDVQPDLNCQVGNINPATVTYKVETRTFEAAEVMKFRFEMLNDLVGATITTDGRVVKSVVKVATLSVKATFYEVTLDDIKEAGNFTFTSKDGANKYSFVVNHEDISIYPITGTKAVLVGNTYWAPINVGATTEDEPGLLYQYGRRKGWSSAQAAADTYTGNMITISQSETDEYKDKFVAIFAGQYANTDWYHDQHGTPDLTALISRWDAPSKNESNPCPNGWRLPTEAEAQELLMGGGQTVTTVGGMAKVTVKNIAFISNECLTIEGGATPQSDESRYWLAAKEYTDFGNYYGMKYIECNRTALAYSNASHGSGPAYSIRCVRTKY